MAELIAKSPCEGLLPLEVGQVQAREVLGQPMALVAPFKGMDARLGAALAAAHGLSWPGPGKVVQGQGCQLQWFGHSHAMLIGCPPSDSLGALAALSDQSDAWAVVALEGPQAAAVLARLTPLDLRDSQFAVGDTARTELFHMSAAITRSAVHCYQIMVFRSMAGTLVHDLKTAMQAVAARS